MKRVVVAIVALALVVALIGLGSLTLLGGGGSTSSTPEPTGESAPQGLEEFYAQTIDWEGCGNAQCGTVTVPVDYQEPSGEKTELSLIRYPATGDGGRVMFVNPGGPGGSAIDFAKSMASTVGDDVRDLYDIVGVDPRGVGQSSPLECLDDAEFDAFTALNPDPTTDADVAALRNATRQMGEACEANSGALARHVSTVEAARDQDIVRALLGQEKLDWFGASYGTQLGATYADLFPERVGRMVLDGAVDPSLDEVEKSYGQAVGFQRALEAYATDCADDDCALGGSKDEVIDSLITVRDELTKEPLKASNGRELTAGLAFYGIALPLYEKSYWPYLTQAAEAVLKGDPSVMLTLSDAYFSRTVNGRYADNSGQVIYAVNCLDASTSPSVDDVSSIRPRFVKSSPLFGGAMAWGAVACGDWPFDSATPQGAVSAEGAAPIVVLGTTRDPATPYEWAESLAAQLQSGVLVTREGDGHTAYLSGNECIVKVVETYFVDGTVPDDGYTCEE